jgi:DNA-binding IclR family transcriptional regulator
VAAVDTAVDVIEALEELDSATVTEVAERLDLSTSAVHSHLATLEQREFVTREGFAYRPSYRFVGIGESLKRVHYDLYRYGRDRAEALSEETQESTQLMIEEHGVGVHVFNSGGDQGIFTEKYPLGRSCPLHISAAGKAILAHLPAERLEAILYESDLEQVTERTITDPVELEVELETIREEGVAFSSEEAARGMRGVAAPVLDSDETILGSINVSCPVSRVTGDRFREDIAQRVTEASNVIEITVTNERKYRNR